MSQLGMMSLLKGGNNLLSSPTILRGRHGGSYDGTEAAESLPAMTSNTTPTGHVASTSGTAAAVGVAGVIQYAPFDKNPASGCAVTPMPCYFQRQVPSPVKVGAYRIAPRSDNNVVPQAPKIFSLLGSNDGSSWVTLDSRAGVVFATTDAMQFSVPINNRGAYIYHRLSVAQSADPSFCAISALELLQDFS